MSALPKGWVEAPLSDLVSLVRGITFTKGQRRDAIEEGLVPCLRTSNVQSELTTSRMAYVPAACVKRDDQLVKPGDLIISMSNSSELVGKVALATDAHRGFSFGAFLAALRSPAFDPRALWYLLKSSRVQQELRRTASQTTNIANISASGMAKIILPVAPLAEQRRIVAKLDTLTTRTARARADLDRIPALAARYKQAVLAKAFSGELTAEWRSSQGLPEPRMARLADLVAEPVRNGLSVRGSDEPPGIRSLRLSALRGGAVNLDDVRFLPISDDHAQRFLLRDGDILVSRGNGTKTLVGISALVGHVREPTIFPDTAFRIRVAQDRVDPQWLCHIWSAPQARTQIEAVAKTTAGIWKVSQADLAGVELPFFELSEQIEMVRRLGHALTEIDRLIVEASAARRLLDRLDQAILTKAFQGELVPQDPADEPADVLLDRIRAERARVPKSTQGRRKAVA